MSSPKVENRSGVVPEELLSGMTINGRFKIGDFLGGGYTGFVRNGKFGANICVFVHFCIESLIKLVDSTENCFSGTDLETGKSIAIKFARKELFHSLEKEYKNYLQLEADGMYLAVPSILLSK